MSGSCYVYIIEMVGADAGGDTGIFKIGLSSNVASRMATLATSSPFPLSLVGWRRLPTREAAQHIEAEMHKSLDHVRMAGEWFRSYGPGLLCEIDTCCIAYFLGSYEVYPEPGDPKFEKLPDFLRQCGASEAVIPGAIEAQIGWLPLCLRGEA